MQKLLFDFAPILLFFISYKFYGVFYATAVAMGASLLQVGWSRYRSGYFETMHLVTLGLILVLGGATLIFHQELFIKWKPTAINWAFAVAFATSQFVGEKPLIRRMMESNIALPDSVWRTLNLSWVGFFVCLGALNLYVVYHFSTDTWVNFKLFGMLALTLVFIFAQAIYMARFIDDNATTEVKPNAD